jgi:phosphoglycerate-specific signal transduction histidine kinase
MQEKMSQTLSLVSRGARYQIRIATLLLTVLPVLVLGFLVMTFFFPPGTFTATSQIALGVTAMALAISGYAILRKYPQNVVKLRHYLHHMAEGELPEKITLENTEDDITAIENYLNQVLSGLRNKVQTLEKQLHVTRAMKAALETQHQELLEAERQRVMIQSLGAACHHIGQPMTVLRAQLYFLRQQVDTPERRAQVAECEQAVNEMADILDNLRNVSAYRTMPYRTLASDEAQSADASILDIEAALADARRLQGRVNTGQPEKSA